MLHGAELAHLVRNLPNTHFLVDGLIPSSSVNIMVGDSGIGKSPLVVQMALAVASGKPFLGQAVRQGNVLLMDYENSLRNSHRILEQQRKHLGLAAYPAARFIYWPVYDDPPKSGLEPIIRKMAPDLVIIDSLRSFCPTMETDNASAVKQLRKLRQIAALRGTAVLLVHHVRKSQNRTLAALEDAPAIEWLTRSAGARALINQTDVRLAIAPPSRPSEADLILRAHYRTHGELGPFFIRRCYDAAENVSGYERMENGPAIIGNPEQEEAFAKLPESFAFGQAREIYGKQNEATTKFLHKMIRLGLLRKTGHGHYRKSGGLSPELIAA